MKAAIRARFTLFATATTVSNPARSPRAIINNGIGIGLDLPKSSTLRDVLTTDTRRTRCRHMRPRATGDYDKLKYSTAVSSCPRLECPASCLGLLEQVGREKIFGRWERALHGQPLPRFR